MAGSPTIGTTFALAGAGRPRVGADKAVLGLGIGPTTVRLEWGPSGLCFAWMTQPLPTLGPVVHEALLKRCDVLGRESNLPRDGTQLHGVFWIPFGRRRRLWKVVAKGGDDASAGQLREHGLWLVSLDARFRIEAIQFRLREREY